MTPEQMASLKAAVRNAPHVKLVQLADQLLATPLFAGAERDDVIAALGRAAWAS